MLACAGPSRPHTCVSGSPGHGGWGGQRSPLWATATGPGLFRSLGFRNPSGYWLFRGQHTAIQRVGRLGGAEAPACVVGVVACVVEAKGVVAPVPQGCWLRIEVRCIMQRRAFCSTLGCVCVCDDHIFKFSSKCEVQLLNPTPTATPPEMRHTGLCMIAVYPSARHTTSQCNVNNATPASVSLASSSQQVPGGTEGGRGERREVVRI